MTHRVKLVTGAEMAAIDRKTIETTETSGAELMERAAGAVVDAIRVHWDGLEGLNVVVVCGKGNNGGDGFAVARLLRQAGVNVRVFLSDSTSEIGGDAGIHLERMAATGTFETAAYRDGQSELTVAIDGADLIVDALLGTGSRGLPREPISTMIEIVAGSGKPVVAVDLPSGLDADTGIAAGACARAALTVTFGLPKRGQLFQPGRSLCGILELADIGFSEQVLDQAPVSTFLLTEEEVGCLLPVRSEDAHKGTCGTVAVLAGSVGMTGAAVLAAEAALRAGAGKVVLGAPASLNDILEIKLTEVMTLPLPEVKKRRCLALRGLGRAQDLIAKADVSALGPGLGQHPETAELVRRLVARIDTPLILDADGLNAISGHADILKERASAASTSLPTVLTPHLGEFARLSGLQKEQIQEDPVARGREFATVHGVAVVLKGAPTVVALPDGRVLVNSCGNSGMATAGSGDVLTGLIAGFLAQNGSPAEAAALGVFIHGLAGDRMRDEMGEWGMLASDIGEAIPAAILHVARSRGDPNRASSSTDSGNLTSPTGYSNV